MRPCSPAWADPLARGAPGRVTLLRCGLRARIVGDGEALVFLHGLGASLRYWGRGYDGLAADRRLIFLDLLGFGGSAKPAGPYDAAQHTAALDDALEELAVADPAIVAHSAGALVAMHYAAARPGTRVVAFGAPIFRSAERARSRVRALGLLARLMADGSPWAERLCAFMCEHRQIARRVAPLLAPRLPAPVAVDGVDHTWDSYRGTFSLIVNQQDTQHLLASLGGRLTLIYGRDDGVCPLDESGPLVQAAPGVRLLSLPSGDHHVPIQYPTRCSEAIRAHVTTG